MVDSLKTFNEGERIYASETNNNNQYLLSKLSDNAAQLQTFVEGEISSIQSNVASVQATLQANIDAVSAIANSKLSGIIDLSTNGYCKLSNGAIIQWGYISLGRNGTVTFSTPFSVSGKVVGTCINWEDNGTGYIFQLLNVSKTSFKYCVRTGGGNSGTAHIWWIAIGY